MIYIFGGAFDPPHVGHTAIVKSLISKKHPEKIVIIPSSERDDKKYNVSDEHRLAMLSIFCEEIESSFSEERKKSVVSVTLTKEESAHYQVSDTEQIPHIRSEGQDHEKVIIDDYFIKNWKGEMITRDVDEYCRKKYGENIVHIFGTDTIESMPSWDNEGYAVKVLKKLFVPRVPSPPQGGGLRGCVAPGSHLPNPPNLGGEGTTKNVSESSPEGGGLRGCVTFISPKAHTYLKEYAHKLRGNQTYPEYIAWKNIFSKKQLCNIKFLRQHTLGPYIVDFYAHALRLIIEIDGDIHSRQSDKDSLRDNFFQTQGYKIVRIPAYEILGNCGGVFDYLGEYITHLPNPPHGGGDKTTESSHNFLLSEKEFQVIENFEIFTDCHIPNISSTELRRIIPEYTGLKAYYEEEPKFIIPGLSKRISRYILDERLYREGSFANELSRSDGGFFSESKSPASFHSAASLQRGFKKPRILVHVCCGPDVTMPILSLRDEYDVICFWYDPNIQPKEEHDKRYEAFVKVCEIEGIAYIKGAYDVKHFFTRIKGLEFTPEKGEKCTNCYDMRMYVAAKLAKKLKIPYYTSSLNTSPKKDLEKLFAIGHKYALKFGITFLDIPFRKKGGFEKSVEYTREHDIFRQNYCGCIYSIPEGGVSEIKGRMVG